MDTVFDRVGSLDCLIISYTLHDQWLWKHLSVNGLCHPKYDVSLTKNRITFGPISILFCKKRLLKAQK